MADPSEPFVPNEHQVVVGKIFGVLGALFGIAIIVSIKILLRRWMKHRGANTASIIAAGPKIRLWKIKFPELDHLPPHERESVFRAAVETPEIQTFRRRAPIFIRALSLLVTATIIAVILFDQAKHVVLLPILVAGAILVMIAAGFVRVQIESRIMRRALTRIVNSPQNGSV